MPNELIKELIQPVQAAMGDRVVEDIRLLVGAKPVADDVTKLVVLDDHQRRIAVVHCSSEVSPGLVARGASIARTAKDMIGEALGRHVLEPLSEGSLHGLSYMITPYCEPLSKGRLRRRLEQFRLRPRILDWLHGVARATASSIGAEATDASYLKPLSEVVEQPDMPDRIRTAADRAIGRITAGRWAPKHVLTHNDFWTDNILISPPIIGQPKRAWADRFTIIDWPGAMVKGYPFVDLSKLAGTFSVSPQSLHREVARHCQTVECEIEDAGSYVLAGMGCLGMNLEHFPLDRYIELTIYSFDMIASLTSVHDA